jgi:DNA-binding response OmpR family regulator
MSSGPPEKHILLVEDNPGDVGLVRLALQAANVGCRLTVLVDGQAALAYVRGGAVEELPALVILDLNVPRHDGLEILTAIRASAVFKTVPVMILSSSSSLREKKKLEELGISRYIVKPSVLEKFLNVGVIVKQILT